MFKNFKKLLGLFSREIQCSPKERLSIEFLLEIDSKDVKVNLILPTNEEISLGNITELSERYAELLVGIDYGLFKEQIFTNLSKIKKDSQEANTILFIDNVMSFYHMIKKDLLNKTVFYERPIIPPSMVFKIHANDKH